MFTGYAVFITRNGVNVGSFNPATDTDGRVTITGAHAGNGIRIAVPDAAGADLPNFSGESDFTGWRIGPGDEPPVRDIVEDVFPTGGIFQIEFSLKEEFDLEGGRDAERAGWRHRPSRIGRGQLCVRLRVHVRGEGESKSGHLHRHNRHGVARGLVRLQFFTYEASSVYGTHDRQLDP